MDRSDSILEFDIRAIRVILWSVIDKMQRSIKRCFQKNWEGPAVKLLLLPMWSKSFLLHLISRRRMALQRTHKEVFQINDEQADGGDEVADTDDTRDATR